MAEVSTLEVVADETGMRLDRWFKAHYPDLSFGHLQKLIRSGQVRVDGGRVKTSTRLEAGQSVRVPPLGRDAAGVEPMAVSALAAASGPAAGRTAAPDGEKPRRAPAAPKSDAAVLRAITLFEDDAVMVFNKPAGLAVQGGSGLTNHLDKMLEALRDAKGQKPRLVHRLDRETSGALVVAKTRQAAQRLTAAFRTRTSRKVYWALVAGVPRPHQGRISTFLAKDEDEDGNDRMIVAKHGDDEASHAVTLYSVVEKSGQKLSWLTMRPVTGRTHQLRAHAAHIGHPIVGDAKYFDIENWELPGGIQHRLHLHARRIVLPHPNGGTIDVTAPLPPHMVQTWNLLGFDAEMGDPADDE